MQVHSRGQAAAREYSAPVKDGGSLQQYKSAQESAWAQGFINTEFDQYFVEGRIDLSAELCEFFIIV